MRWAWLLALYGCRIGFDATDRSDATRGDDGSGDSTTIDGPAVVGCPVFAMFCDDFELGNLSRWTKTDVTVAAGYVKASGARVRNGSFALEAFSPAGTTEVVDAVLQFSAQTTGTLAVRSWFNATIRLDGYDLVTALSNKQTPQYATAGGNSSSLWVSTEADVNDMGFDHPSSTPTPNTDVWTCLE